MTTDRSGRPWAKLSELRAGEQVILDAGFTCTHPRIATVYEDTEGLYFNCDNGRHSLDGQADDGEHLIGIYKA